jgi:hypothetical protein
MTMGWFSFKKDDNTIKMTGELKRLRKRINELDSKLSGSAGKLTDSLTGTLAGFTTELRKLSLGQKEVSLQLEEISELFETPEDSDAVMVNALIGIAGQIENFYRLMYKDEASPLYRQASMMWEAAVRSLKQAGITIIDGEGTTDLRLHEPAGTEWNEAYPEGSVLRTVNCGYIYKDNVIKRASVIINKKGMVDNDSRN